MNYAAFGNRCRQNRRRQTEVVKAGKKIMGHPCSRFDMLKKANDKLYK